jgi:hypothetical protein
MPKMITDVLHCGASRECLGEEMDKRSEEGVILTIICDRKKKYNKRGKILCIQTNGLASS